MKQVVQKSSALRLSIINHWIWVILYDSDYDIFDEFNALSLIFSTFLAARFSQVVVFGHAST